MIPKKIHYCWFGRGEMPKLALDCIESWNKFLPDYELVLWNEDSFDVTSIPYTNEAYNAKKYAFVTDYVRLHAIYNFGGVYMDTDVEVLKSLDVFLDLPAFSGFETETEIPTGIMAGQKNNEWFKIQLDHYNNKHFIHEDGSFDMTTNVEIITNSMKNDGFLFNNTLQDYKGIVTFYPKDFFCPKSYINNKIELTENTYCIHHFAASWLSPTQRFKKKIMRLLGTNFMGIYGKIKDTFSK